VRIVANVPYWLVLTHDIDMMSLRELPITGKTFWGFAYRCLWANTRRFIRRRISFTQYLDSLKTFLCIPLIKLGLAEDPLKGSVQDMLNLERGYGVRSTLYFVTRAKYAGHTPDGDHAPAKRCTHYELSEYKSFLIKLEKEGWEVGVHGIDAYRSLDDAKGEMQVIRDLFPEKDKIGIRMHYLYYKYEETWRILDQAGYCYDATLGWNDRTGYPGGHYRPFRPDNADGLTILPLNIQDTALLANLSMDEAWLQVESVLNEASQKQAVVTILWHNNSFVAYRYWTDLYKRIIERAQADGAAIIRAIDAVNLFNGRAEAMAGCKHELKDPGLHPG